MSNQISLKEANVTLLIVGYFPCKPDWKIPLNKAKNDCLFYIEKGKGWIDFEGQRVETKAGDWHVFKKGHYYELNHDKKDQFSVYSVLFLLDQPNQLRPLEILPFAHTYHLKKVDQKLVVSLYKKIITHYQSNKCRNELLAKSLLLQMIAQLIEIENSYPLSAKIINTKAQLKDNSRINKAISFIYENMAKNITVKELSELCHLTTDHFTKLFKQEIGDSPKNYVRKVKINHAKALMASTDKTINQIAREVGILDPFYFSRSFKQITGSNPTQYMKSLKSPWF